MLSRTKTYILTLFFLIIHSCYNWCLQKNWTVGAATSVDYSPDGKYIAVGGISNNSVLIYDAVTFNFLFAVNATVTSPANTVRISRNNLIAIGYKNGNIQVMDLTNRSPIGISISGQTIINSVDFSPSGQLLAVCGNSAATIYNLSTPTSMTSIGTISTGFIACSFTYDSNLLTATSATPSVVGYYSGPNFSGSIANSTSYSLGGISCLAYRFDNATTYTYITGSDSKSN
jgi:WD40 repeat protein